MNVDVGQSVMAPGWLRPVLRSSAAVLIGVALAACGAVSNPFAPGLAAGQEIELWIEYGNHSRRDYVLWIDEGDGASTSSALTPGCGSVGTGVLTAPFTVHLGPGPLPPGQPDSLPPIAFDSSSLPADVGEVGYTVVISADGGSEWTPLERIGDGSVPDELCFPPE